MMNSQSMILIILGCILLFVGRKLFWLFVGAVGFSAGLEAGTHLFAGQPHSTILIGAIGLGLLGILIALLLQKLAIGFAGFVAGSYMTLTLLHTTSPHLAQIGWLIVLMGGVVGLVLMLTLFEWALIVLSSLIGANLVVHAVHAHALAPYGLIPLVALAIIGILVQAGLRSRRGSNRG